MGFRPKYWINTTKLSRFILILLDFLCFPNYLVNLDKFADVDGCMHLVIAYIILLTHRRINIAVTFNLICWVEKNFALTFLSLVQLHSYTPQLLVYATVHESVTTTSTVIYWHFCCITEKLEEYIFSHWHGSWL